MATAKTTPAALDQFVALLRDAIRERTFIKLTLSSPCGPDKTLVNVFVRPVILQAVRLSAQDARHHQESHGC